MRISEGYAAQSPTARRQGQIHKLRKAPFKNPGTITLRCSVENILLVSSSLYFLLLKVSHVQKAVKVKHCYLISLKLRYLFPPFFLSLIIGFLKVLSVACLKLLRELHIYKIRVSS